MSIVIRGVGAAPGLALGQATVWFPRGATDEVPVLHTADPHRLRAIAAQVADQLRSLERELADRVGPEAAAILGAQALIAEDPELLSEIDQLLSESVPLGQAIRRASEVVATTLDGLEDDYLRQRAADVRDVAGRLIAALDGQDDMPPAPYAETILVAVDLAPSLVVRLDPNRVKAIVIAAGGPTSHTSILARGLGIPVVSGCGDALGMVREGDSICADGTAGVAVLHPEPDEVSRVHEHQSRAELEARAAARRSAEPAVTTYGRRIGVRANLSSAREATAALAAGAEGVGLMRTEFLFLERRTLPSEEDQFAEYRAVVEAMAPWPVVIRTLDIGGDKSVPALELPREDNPYLGWRGVRLWLDREDLAVPQLRALLRAARFGRIDVLLPMVTDVAEVCRARALIERVRVDLGDPAGPCRLGVMIEVPAAALAADQLAAEVDFFSIGTNDLTQYTLAADRGNSRTARLFDPLHPAVLRLIEMAVRGGRSRGIPVAVCGDLASDPRAVPVLIELGVDELSVPVSAIAATKNQIRGLREPRQQ
jgi:phosphoenolpyruvate-protein phosphotransferase